MEIKTLNITCDWCPAQIEAELDNGLFLYARSRFGQTTIGIGKDTREAIYKSVYNPNFVEITGDDLDCIGSVRLQERVIEFVKELV